jgi:hypothetical protein
VPYQRVYWLETFNVTIGGHRTEVSIVGQPFPGVAIAIAEAYKLQRGTHYRICWGGQIVLEDNLACIEPAAAA